MKTTIDKDNPLTQTRIRICIPEKYHHEPVISRLISHHGLTVNIAAALLGANTPGEGWFDLELSGTTQQISDALAYLYTLELEIWPESNSLDDWY